MSIDEGITDPIPDISRKPIYVFKTPDQRCRVNVLNSTYLRCNGTWKLLKERVLRRFVNTSRRFTTDQVVIKVGANGLKILTRTIKAIGLG